MLTTKNQEETDQIIRKLKGHCFFQTDVDSHIKNIENEYQAKVNNASANSQNYENKTYHLDKI